MRGDGAHEIGSTLRTLTGLTTCVRALHVQYVLLYYKWRAHTEYSVEVVIITLPN